VPSRAKLFCKEREEIGEEIVREREKEISSGVSLETSNKV